MAILQTNLVSVGGFNVKVWMVAAIILAIVAFKALNK